MTKIKTVEELISAYIDNNNKKVIGILEKEIQTAKNQGKYNVAKRLKNLLTKIPETKTLSGQNTSARTGVELKNNLLYEKIESNIHLDEVVLDKTLKLAISDFLREWDDFKKLAEFDVFPSNKLLFYGPPGTGKTKLAFAIANYLNFPLILVRLDELISSYLGKTGKNIREIFDIARNENVVILLDEIDTIAKHRDDDKELGELKRVVTVLLQNIDNFPHNSIIIGATNNENLLDKAVWRRFSLKLRFTNPNEENRQLLFELYMRNFPNNLDFKILSELSDDFSGSMIQDICQKVKKQSIIQGKQKIATTDFIKSILSYGSIIDSNYKVKKKNLYEMCQILKDNKYSLKDIEELTGIAYTTLRDNIT